MEDYSKYSDIELKKERIILSSKVSKLNNNQLALKYLMNKGYGFLANKYSRWFDIRLASAITLSGQLSIKWIEKFLTESPLQKKYGWNVIYADTDSLFIELNQLVTKLKLKNPQITDIEIVDKIDLFIKKIVLPLIDDGYQQLAKYMNTNENLMVMSREKIIFKAMWIGRKKYAMLVYDDEGVRYSTPELKVKGIEIVRSSTPKIIRNSLKIAVRYIIEDIDKFYDFMDKYKKEFDTYSIEDIAFPRSVNLEKYIDGNSYKKGTPIAARAAITYNKFIKKFNIQDTFSEIQSGEKIKFIYMKLPNPAHENIFGFLKKFPRIKKLDLYVDKNLQFEKVFKNVVKNICNHLNIPIERNKNNSINDLF